MTLRLVPDLPDTSAGDTRHEEDDPAGGNLDETTVEVVSAQPDKVVLGSVESGEDRQAAAIEALAVSVLHNPDAPLRDTLHRRDALASEHASEMLLGYHDPATTASMEMAVSGGWSRPATPSLSHWEAVFTCTRRTSDGEVIEALPVARMTLTVANPIAGDPLGDLSFHDEDAGELGEALFCDTGERTPAFAAITDDDYRPVLLVTTYTVEDDWRGTTITPVLAVRALSVFAHLGIDTAALCAAPISEDLPVPERERVADRIAAMWTKVGFERLDTAATDGQDPLVMALPLEGHALAETLHLLVGTDEILIAAAAL